MRIVVTGGAGYLGTHTVLRLLEDGHEVLVVDNLSNAHPEGLRRVGVLAGRQPRLARLDLRDAEALATQMRHFGPEAVIHMAGLKSVAESVRTPLDYYETNVLGTLNLLQALMPTGCRILVFSSSASVYGEQVHDLCAEIHPLAPTTPYGRTKLHVDQLLADLAISDPGWAVASLRYFNPVGAHPSGQIGEDPCGDPSNLLPLVAQVAAGRREELLVFGADHDTPDGTGVRDYLHVMDLVEGHVAALAYLRTDRGSHVWNVGTGRGFSVLEVIEAFAAASGRPVRYRVVDRRPGDVARSVADPTRAQIELAWRATRDLHEMCQDLWRWQWANPDGYLAPLAVPS